MEKSCQITTSEMNPATWKAYALADIVTRLMAKNRSYEWNADMKTLPDDLRTMTIDSLLQVGHLKLVLLLLKLTAQKPAFENTPCPEELVLLVTLTTKTAYHQIDSYSVRPWTVFSFLSWFSSKLEGRRHSHATHLHFNDFTVWLLIWDVYWLQYSQNLKHDLNKASRWQFSDCRNLFYLEACRYSHSRCCGASICYPNLRTENTELF